MSRPGGRRCPPALLALLLALPGGRGFPECRGRSVLVAVSAEESLLLKPQNPPREWKEVEWRVKADSGGQERILTARRGEPVSYSNGSFHGRSQFLRDTLSLGVSPVRRADSGLYKVEINIGPEISSRCFRVSVWEPVRPPRLEIRTVRRERGWCLLSLLCSSPSNVSYGWSCPGDPPGRAGNGSRLLRRVPEDAEPQMCLCNASGPAGWNAARARLSCPRTGVWGKWAAVAVGVALLVALVALVSCCCWRRKRGRNSRQATPGTPPEQPLTVYAEVGVKKPGQDPTGTSEATQEGATIYALVSPRTLELPRSPEELGNCTIYSTVQFGRRPSSSTKRKRLDRALVSTAYLEDNGGCRRLGFPPPAGRQRP